MQKIANVLKREPMLFVSLVAVLASFLITPPDRMLLQAIDWKTLSTLLMLLLVLDGFKKENLFLPLIRLASNFATMKALTFFFVFSVFFSSMFVTNDVSLIIFVPLTMFMFRSGGKEKYIIPVLVLENIAAVRGSLLTPFGSPQNLFLFGKSGISAVGFVKMMLPLWLLSALLLVGFILFLYRHDIHEKIDTRPSEQGEWEKNRQLYRIMYFALFAIVLATILSRTAFWPYVTLFVVAVLLVGDRRVFLRVDYVLLLAFLCFFVFSSSLTANRKVYGFLSRVVAGNEYVAGILLSQIISNVPASIVLWPFCDNLRALLYGLDSAGLVFIIGSLASVIDLRLYSREYPGRTVEFLKWFEIISLAFFAIVAVPQMLLL